MRNGVKENAFGRERSGRERGVREWGQGESSQGETSQGDLGRRETGWGSKCIKIWMKTQKVNHPNKHTRVRTNGRKKRIGGRQKAAVRSGSAAHTSGVSNIRLTCSRLVMCQVYLEKVPSGRASLRTKAARDRVHRHVSQANLRALLP